MSSKPVRTRLILAILMASGLLASADSHAECGKFARIIVGTSAGGGGDNVARLLAAKLDGRLADHVIVENHTGADGVIAASDVARAAPDGCTLLLATSGHMLRPFATKKLPYNTLTDLVGVTAVTRSPALIVASPDLKFDSPSGFVAMLKANPGKYNYATPEILGQITVALFNHQVGVDATRVPYRGTASMMPDLASGIVQYAASSISAAQTLVAGGRLKAVGVAGTERAQTLPQVPTFKEYGIDFVLYNRYGLFAPGSTPRAALENAQRAVAAALQDPALAKALKLNGDEPVGNSVDQFQGELRQEYELFKATAAQAGIVPE
jgi:tripartite-type tricarboxylate transporter receptor subunit TctC